MREQIPGHKFNDLLKMTVLYMEDNGFNQIDSINFCGSLLMTVGIGIGMDIEEMASFMTYLATGYGKAVADNKLSGSFGIMNNAGNGGP